MAQDPQRQAEHRDPPRDEGPGAPAETSAPIQVRLVLQVPPEVAAELARLGKRPAEEVARVLKALIQKLTPRPRPHGRGRFAAEVQDLADLFDLPFQVLNLKEQFFVVLSTAHEGLDDLDTEGQEAMAQEIAQAATDLSEWVQASQQLVIQTRGIDDPAEEAA